MLLVIDNRIRIGKVDLSPSLIVELKKIHEHENPHRYVMQKMGIPVWKEPHKLRTWTETKSELSLPRGTLSKILPLLTDAGHDVEIVDRREEGVPIKLPPTRRVLYPYQLRIVAAAIKEEQCLIQATQGAGKTTAFVALASEIGLPVIVVVPNKTLLDQWKKRVVEELGLTDKQIGIVKGGKTKLRPVTIGIQGTVARLANTSKEFREYFGCLVFDEVHGAAAKSAYEAVDAMPARFRIGCSADLKRKDKKHPLINDLFGDAAIEVTREELISSGHVLDVEVRAVPTDFGADWYGMPEEESDETIFDLPSDSHMTTEIVEEKKIDFVRLVREMSECPNRNAQIVRLVREEANAGAQVLVLTHLVEHVMRLGQTLSGMGVKTGYLLGGADGATEFKRTADGLRKGEVQVGVGTYKACGVGLDLPRVDVGIAATPIASNKQFFGQVRGRLCRTSEGKTGARLYVILDHQVFPSHANNLCAWNAKVIVKTDSGWKPARQWIREQRSIV